VTPPRLHVGVNLLWLVPGVVGGSEEYTTRLISAIAERDPGAGERIELTLFVLRPFVASYPDLVEAFDTVVCPLSGGSKAARVAAEASWLLAAARRRRVEVLHHAGGTIPLLRATPSLLTIHDLQPLLLVGSSHGAVKQAYLRARLGPSARRARLIVTLTEFTRSTIVDRLGVERDKVMLVPPGYTPALVQEPEGDPRAAYRLDRAFFLYPAITYPHKNHTTAVRALARLVERGDDVLLVLTGRAGDGEDELWQVARSLGVDGRIRRLGRVPRGDLDWLYRHAAGLVFPSRFEGFGLPVLEAMGQGCPVIAARATALPEVVGEAGILVDPDDVEGWADAMACLLHDARRRDWLVEASIARTVEFRWRASADALVAAYRRAGGIA